MGVSKKDLTNFPESESAKDMLSFVTEGFYDKSYVGKWIYEVIGRELDGHRVNLEDLANQFFPETATWGLKYHEIKWGLPVREELPYEKRRQLVMEKRDYRAPMTPYKMELALKNATGFTVHVLDVMDSSGYDWTPDHPNKFRVIFEGEGSADMKKALAILNRLKQSHTMFVLGSYEEITLDHRDMEHIELANVRFGMKLSFWGGLLLDGSFYLDGSQTLGSGNRYGLSVGFLYAIGGIKTEESLGEMKIIRKNEDCMFLDGKYALDGSHKLDSFYREEIVE